MPLRHYSGRAKCSSHEFRVKDPFMVGEREKKARVYHYRRYDAIFLRLGRVVVLKKGAATMNRVPNRIPVTRVAEPSHFDGSGSRAPKTGGSASDVSTTLASAPT